MHFRIGLATALALIASLGTNAADPPAVLDGVRALDGEWVYVEYRTEGCTKEQQGPNMGPRIFLRVEKGAVVLGRNEGEIRMPLDGAAVEIVQIYEKSRYRGEWKDGAYFYESVPVREGDNSGKGTIRWKMRVTSEGLLAGVTVDPPTGKESTSLFRHPQDIELPKPAKAAMADLAWLSGAWVGSRGEGGTTTFEERWSPPAGGAMLAVTRTVSRGKMVGFEFLRIVERDGGLVYIAQPGGRTPTEFALTELTRTRAVFENPRHDSPQRIVYEVPAEGKLTASIGFMRGGTPRRFEFKSEGAGK